MKRNTNQRKNRFTKIVHHQKAERLLPSEIHNKASNLPTLGGYVGQKWYPRHKAKG